MTKRRKGVIINIGSVAAYTYLPFSAAYSSTKAAVHSYSNTLRIELAPLGVRVICVAPGRITSGFGNTALQNVTLPERSSPYYEASKLMQERANLSQTAKSTPASDLAKAVRKEGERQSFLARAYLTYGRSSWIAWLFYYMPPFFGDFLLTLAFKLKSIRK